MPDATPSLWFGVTGCGSWMGFAPTFDAGMMFFVCGWLQLVCVVVLASGWRTGSLGVERDDAPRAAGCVEERRAVPGCVGEQRGMLGGVVDWGRCRLGLVRVAIPTT
jgi:hypothetical protein